jgi:hypothetical protein
MFRPDTGSTFLLFSNPVCGEQVGIGLAIFSNALISVSLNVQKYAHNKNEALGDLRKPYHKIPVWW